jgi:site-specific DNA recombinase
MKLSVQTYPQDGKTLKRKNAAIYARVSSDQQKAEETIDSQIDVLQRFSMENAFEITPELVIRDEAESGPSLDRPGLDLLRDLAYDGVLDALFIYSPDRLARRFVYQLILEEEFKKFGVQIFYYKARSHGNSPEDMLLTHCQAVFAEYEHAQILDRTRRGKLYKVRKGMVSVLPSAPFGYSNIRDESFYTIKDDNARVVKDIFRLYVYERFNLRQICRRLEEQGIKAPRGGARWDSKTLKGILGNTAYTGTAYFGKTESYVGQTERTVRYKSRGKVVQPIKAKKSRSKDLWDPISVPQFISENDFEIAQTILRKNQEFASRNTKEPSILQGLLVCGICGCSYYKKRRVKNDVAETRYTCHSHLLRDKKGCGNRSLKQPMLDKLVWDNIIELLKNPVLIQNEIDRRCTEGTIHKPDTELRIAELKKDIRQIEKAYNKLLDAYQEGECLSLDQLRTRSKDLKTREAFIKKEIASIEALHVKEAGYQNINQTLKMMEEKIEKSYHTLSIKDKQVIVRALVSDIVILPGEIEIKHAIQPLEKQNVLLCGVGGN